MFKDILCISRHCTCSHLFLCCVVQVKQKDLLKLAPAKYHFQKRNLYSFHFVKEKTFHSVNTIEVLTGCELHTPKQSGSNALESEVLAFCFMFTLWDMAALNNRDI